LVKWKPTTKLISNKKILFLTLYTFSLTGGIEKVCRSFSKVLQDLLTERKISDYKVLSMYDQSPDLNYVDQKSYIGFNGRRINFAIQVLTSGLHSDVIILSHVNLLIFGWLIKKLQPKKRIILFAHGIEIWEKLSKWKTNFIRKQVEIIAVSKYTALKIEEVHQLQANKITVINNCLDPFFNNPVSFEKPQELINRYHLKEENRVLFTLSRLSSDEQYKGYDHVIEALAELPEHIIYILSGKADLNEAQRIKNLIAKNHLQQRVILTCFVPDEEIEDHYLLADVFVMPSKGEGFGISFIEAAACGCRSVTGNMDGSTDAILNGALGQSVNPHDKAALKTVILDEVNSNYNKIDLQQKCLAAFVYEKYKERVRVALVN